MSFTALGAPRHQYAAASSRRPAMKPVSVAHFACRRHPNIKISVLTESRRPCAMNSQSVTTRVATLHRGSSAAVPGCGQYSRYTNKPASCASNRVRCGRSAQRRDIRSEVATDCHHLTRSRRGTAFGRSADAGGFRGFLVGRTPPSGQGSCKSCGLGRTRLTACFPQAGTLNPLIRIEISTPHRCSSSSNRDSRPPAERYNPAVRGYEVSRTQEFPRPTGPPGDAAGVRRSAAAP